MTHSVIKNIKARKNKKVPVADGRNIALVNFGGFMTGVNSAGAMLALVEMGYQDSFDSIYTISSGFANASSFLSGDGRRNISVYYEDLCSGLFLRPEKFWKILDLDFLVKVLKDVKPINVNAILKKHTKLYVRLKVAGSKTESYLEVHDFSKKHYFDLIKAASSVPLLSPGKITIKGKKYKDPIWTNRQITDHLKYVLATPATDIFVIYSQYQQYIYAKKHLKPFASEKIVHVYPSKNLSLDLLENNPKKLKKAAISMGRKTKKLFGLHQTIKLFKSSDEKPKRIS